MYFCSIHPLNGTDGRLLGNFADSHKDFGVVYVSIFSTPADFQIQPQT